MPKNPETEGGPRLVTIKEIAEEYDVSRVSIHTYRRRGVFPQPVEGEGTTRIRFRSDEVAAFFAANPKQPGKRTDRAPKSPQQGEPMDARKDLYAFAMQGKEHSPAISDRASEKIDAYQGAVIREAAQRLYTALFPAVYNDLGQKAAEGVNRAVSELRRMADEGPEPDAYRASILRDFLWRLEQSSGHNVAAKLVEENPDLDELLSATEATT